MAETEAKAPNSKQETAPAGGDVHATIALSEENLLALLGSSAPPSGAVKGIAPAPANVSFNVVPAPIETPPAPPIHEPLPPAQATPLTARTVRPLHVTPPEVMPNRAVPAAKTPSPQPAATGVDSTLALLAAIKENRAGLLRSEGNAKAAQPASLPEVAPSAAPENVAQTTAAEPPAKVQQSKLPEAKAAPTRVPTSSVGPAPLSVAERIDRHPAMPISRNSTVASNIPAYPSFPSDSPSQSPALAASVASAIDKLPGGRMTLLIIGGVIAIGGIATGLILRSHRAAAATHVVAAVTPAPPPANNFPLQLQVEPEGKQINIRWNPQSTLIAQAREGRLVITEANQKPRTVALALDQLKFGHLTYQPLSEHVELRLEVVDASGSVAEESVLSLANPPAPAPAATAPVKPALPAQATPAALLPAQPVPAVTEPPKAARTPARPFTPPAVNRTPGEASIDDVPPEVNTNVAAPASLPAGQEPRAAAPPSPAVKPAPQQPLQVEGSVQAAKLITKVTPAYPPLAKSARVQGAVRFRATVGKDGSVRNLEVIGGPAILRQAAIDAVKKWKYQPTLLNGQPVEVVTSMEVNFTLNQ